MMIEFLPTLDSEGFWHGIVGALKFNVPAILASEGFWHGVIVAVILAVVAKSGQWLWGVLRQVVQSRHEFDISGNWISDCWLPSYGNARFIEIWRYSRNGDRVNLTFFAYDPNVSEPKKWSGGGIYRGPKLSAYYYQCDKSTYESGVIALELTTLRLKGVYAQFDPKVEKGKEPLFVSDTEYFQKRIKLSFFPRVKMFLGFPPFRTYAEVKEVYDSTVKTSG